MTVDCAREEGGKGFGGLDDLGGDVFLSTTLNMVSPRAQLRRIFVSTRSRFRWFLLPADLIVTLVTPPQGCGGGYYGSQMHWNTSAM